MADMQSQQRIEAGLAKIITTYQLADKREGLTALVNEVLQGKKKISDIGFALDKLIGEDPDKNMEILLDLEELLVDVTDVIDAQEGEAEMIAMTVAENRKILDALVKELIREAELKISDDVLLRRFENLSFSWFRDVRDDIETKSTAMRETRVGGLGFNEKQAERLLQILKKKETEYASRGVTLSKVVNNYLDQKEELFEKQKVEDIEIDVPTIPQESIQKTSYRKETGETTIDQLLSAEGKEKAQSLAQAIQEKEDRIEAHEELPPPSPAITQSQGELAEPRLDARAFQGRPREDEGAEKTVREVSDEIMQRTPVKRVTPEAAQIQKRAPQVKKKFGIFSFKKSPRPAHPGNELPKAIKEARPLKKTALTASGRPRVEDIKFTPKLYGPVDELASLAVDDFRRLAKDADEAAQKIKNKLELLADDSLSKKKEGMDALHSSELYKTYTDILKKSVVEGKSYEEILQKNPVITLSELRAIMKLNKQLKQ